MENEGNDVPPPVIEANHCTNDLVSEVSVPSLANPIAVSVQNAASNIGLPATPLLRSFKNMDESMFEKGYDSDGERGPFFDQVLSEGELVCPEESFAGEECVRESARGGADRFSPDSPNVAAVTEDAPEEPKDVKKMKVVELKEELKKRNQPIRGNKAELQERLLDAMQNNAPLVADQDATRVDNMAGPSYNHNAYWKLVSNESGDELLDECEQMQIDGLQFRAPGVPEAELDNTLGPKKRNYTMAFDRPPFVQNVLLPK